MAGNIDARLAELGIALPEASTPQANYVPYTVSGNLVFVSGQIPKIGDDMITGKLGADADLETGQKAARYCALNIIAQVKNACGGDLDRITRCLKLGGFVNGAPDVIVEIFGDAGRHARFAVAVACLTTAVILWRLVRHGRPG